MFVGHGFPLTKQMAAGAGEFSPASLSPTLWLDASETLYSNEAGSTPATTDGTGILNVPDKAGGAAMTRPSAGAVLRIENSTRVISFEGGYLNRAISSGSLSAYSIHALVRFNAPSVNAVLFSFGSNAANPSMAPQWILGKGIVVGLSAVGSGEVHPLYHCDSTWRVLSAIYNGTSVRTFLDGAEIGPASGGTGAAIGETNVASSFTRAGHAIGRDATNGQAGAFRLHEIVYSETAHTRDDVDAMDAYFRAKTPALFNTTDPQIVWVWNSLGQNYVVNPNQTIPYLVLTNSTKVNRMANCSRPSITTAGMLLRVTDDYANFFVAPNPRIACVLEGYNDSGTAAARMGRLTSLYQALRAGGATVVLGATLPVRTDRANEDLIIDALNPLILASADLDGVMDFGADGTLRTPAHDGVHWSAAQNATAAATARTLIDSFIP